MEQDKIKIGAIGAGSWGTTLANLLADKGYTVDLWVREEEVYEQIKKDRINSTFLPGMKLVDNLNPVKTFEEALALDCVQFCFVLHLDGRGLFAYCRAGLG